MTERCCELLRTNQGELHCPSWATFRCTKPTCKVATCSRHRKHSDRHERRA